MDFETFKMLLLDADTNGTLMSAKHDPNQVSTIYTPFRSVLSHELASNLTNFIKIIIQLSNTKTLFTRFRRYFLR
jgi:hypothetical protein